jgi:STE20-like kinase
MLESDLMPKYQRQNVFRIKSQQMEAEQAERERRSVLTRATRRRCRQLKEIFLLQRHQMLVRHDKEIEQIRRLQQRREVRNR